MLTFYFVNAETNIMCHVKVLPKKFRSNGNIVGIYPQTQELEPHTK